MNADIEAIAEQKLKFRCLIDNARSDQAGLTDNEIVTFLMTAQGFTESEIARVLVKNNVGQGRPTMSRSNVWMIKRSAFRKVRAVSGLNDVPFMIQEETEMPRGVYPRKTKSDSRPARDGRTDPVAEVTPPADPVHFWGQPYEIDARDMLFDVFCDEAERAVKNTAADKAVVFPFQDEEHASQSAQALQAYFSQRGDDVARAWFRRNPPRVIVMRGPDWK